MNPQQANQQQSQQPRPTTYTPRSSLAAGISSQAILQNQNISHQQNNQQLGGSTYYQSSEPIQIPHNTSGAPLPQQLPHPNFQAQTPYPRPTQQLQQQQQLNANPNCECGGLVNSRTSQSEKNPGRDFFSCQNCGGFTWHSDWDGVSLLIKGDKLIVNHNGGQIARSQWSSNKPKKYNNNNNQADAYAARQQTALLNQLVFQQQNMLNQIEEVRDRVTRTNKVMAMIANQPGPQDTVIEMDTTNNSNV